MPARWSSSGVLRSGLWPGKWEELRTDRNGHPQERGETRCDPEGSAARFGRSPGRRLLGLMANEGIVAGIRRRFFQCGGTGNRYEQEICRGSDLRGYRVTGF